MSNSKTTQWVSLEDLDRRSSLHPFASVARNLESGPLIFAEGQGVTLRDTWGREYIDGMAGLWCVNVGYGRREIIDAICAQAGKLAFFHFHSAMATEPPIRLADRIVGLAPKSIKKVLFGVSGSDANDTNIKLIWYYNNLQGRPKKKKIISRRRSYHGATLGAGSLSGLPILHRQFDLPLPQMKHVSEPCFYWGAKPGMNERDYSISLAEELDALIEAEGPDTVAAFAVEPVMGAGGVLTPPEGYFAEIGKVLNKHDVLLLVDEVICGFGRLGSWFGSTLFGLEPDLMTLGKGLTSAYQPMAASLVSERIWNTLLEHSPKEGPLGIGHTYAAHPCAAAAAMANLDVIERDGLLANAIELGAYLLKRLSEQFSESPIVGQVRGLGLMAGLDLVADKEKRHRFPPDKEVARRIVLQGYEKGVIARALPNSDCIALSPPLCIAANEVDRLVERLALAVTNVADQLTREGIWVA
jgi:L-2,4-diaminobutyrate transaminase